MHTDLLHIVTIILLMSMAPQPTMAATIGTRDTPIAPGRLYPLSSGEAGNGQMRPSTVCGMIIGLGTPPFPFAPPWTFSNARAPKAGFLILVIACQKIWTAFDTHHRPSSFSTRDYAHRPGRIRTFFQTLHQTLSFAWFDFVLPRRFGRSTSMENPIARSRRESVVAMSQVTIQLSSVRGPTPTYFQTYPRTPSTISNSDSTVIASASAEVVTAAEPSPPQPAYLAPQGVPTG
jgi:hypothetical protein